MIDKIQSGCLAIIIIIILILLAMWNIYTTKLDIEYKKTIIEMGGDDNNGQESRIFEN